MTKEILGLGELKNRAMGFDRAEVRDVHVMTEHEDYLVKDVMGVWNVDKSMLACLAPKNYAVIQHKQATEAIIDAISSLNIKASAELQLSKHGIHLDLDFPETKFELKEVGEQFTTGIRIVNRYDLVAGLVISPRVTRLACSNGMIVTDVVKSQRVKFFEEMNITVEGIIDNIIKDIITNDEKLANYVSICMRDSVEWDTLKLLIKHMFKSKKHVKAVYTRMNSEKERPTRWDLYNAVTNYATHGERIKPKLEAWLQNKAQGIFKTPFKELCEINIPVNDGT